MRKYLKKLVDLLKKTDKKKRGYLIAITLIIVIMSWAFISAGIITSNFEREQIKKSSANEQKVKADGIIITETKDGNKSLEIYGENGNYNNTDRLAILENVIGNLYKNGEVTMSFQSTKGTYNEQDNIITLYEHTYIVLKNDTSLEADKLIWSGSDKDTIAEGHVKIKKGNELVSTADKCIISAGYDSFKIVGNTKTKLFKDKEN